MAVSLDTLTQTIASISDDVSMALTQTTPFLQYSKSLGKIHYVDGGITQGSYTLQIPVEVKQGTVATNLSTGYEVINTSQTNTTDWARYTWGRQTVPFSLAGRETSENMGEAAVVKLAETRYKSAQNFFMRAINKQIVVGNQTSPTSFLDNGSLNGAIRVPTNGAANPNGVSTGFLENQVPASQANTVGGLSRATYNIPVWTNQFQQGTSHSAPWFASNGLNAFQRIRTFASLNREQATDDKTFHLILTSANCYDAYYQAQYSNVRYIKQNELDSGAFVMAFGDAPVVADPAMTAAIAGTGGDISAYFLNLDGIQLAILKGSEFKVGEFIATPNQDVITAHILFEGGLILRNAGMQGILMDAES